MTVASPNEAVTTEEFTRVANNERGGFEIYRASKSAQYLDYRGRTVAW